MALLYELPLSTSPRHTQNHLLQAANEKIAVMELTITAILSFEQLVGVQARESEKVCIAPRSEAADASSSRHPPEANLPTAAAGSDAPVHTSTFGAIQLCICICIRDVYR